MADDLSRNDVDPIETEEWLDSLDSVLDREGPERARYLLDVLIERARQSGVSAPFSATTPYVNTIPVDQQPSFPGDAQLEERIQGILRWNAMAMVVRANKRHSGLGGHIASYASSAALYEVGFNHFFHAPGNGHGGDLVMIQGHSSPGIYARAYLEGRLDESRLDRFRQEVEPSGLSSYPHPWLMPEFWQFPTVSMGLGPIMAIYQARFMKYLTNRGIADTEGRKVWAFLGDGETDEPESLGAIGMAARENLDNLIFVINCNLQRLDGPVRGNGKIIQELEGVFRGAGWNVIKVLWGSNWDPLLARDEQGLLRKRMQEALDGEYQAFKAKDGAFVRKHFFGVYPQLAGMVQDMSDDQIWALNRGGHDSIKLYAAYRAAVDHRKQPTVILAKTVKGFGMGDAGEGLNIAHQQKKMAESALKSFRDSCGVPVADEDIASAPYYRPAQDSAEMRYLQERRKELGGHLPARRRRVESLKTPGLDAFGQLLKGSAGREQSTTMAFVRILSILLRERELSRLLVPIVADEARTFGMEGLFRQIGIYSPKGQLYRPVDRDQLMFYREAKDGQLLQEGISEAGSACSWIAAGTSYSNHAQQMIPFFIFYSMFGFQRIGDLIWAAGDIRSRGFLIGGTSGRTTLNGEGLQHEDGHSHLISANFPSCLSYDPAFGFELAVIIQDGLRRMYQEQEDVFYYITTMNENYVHPPMPEGAEEGIRQGLYLLRPGADAEEGDSHRVQLMASGAILREALAAAEWLEAQGVAADVWSATSFTQLRREGLACERWNRLHPGEEQRSSYVEKCLKGASGPVIAASDYAKSFADQIRAFVPGRYVTLGTDGYGRSDTRERLRSFFEVDRRHICLAAFKALVDEGGLSADRAEQAIGQLKIDSEKPDPFRV